MLCRGEPNAFAESVSTACMDETSPEDWRETRRRELTTQTPDAETPPETDTPPGQPQPV